MNIYDLSFLLLFHFLFSCNQPVEIPKASYLTDRLHTQHTDSTETAKIVFKSTDGGQTWQDISKGLPENLRKDSIRGNSFFANDKGLFLRVGNELYHNKQMPQLLFGPKRFPLKQIAALPPVSLGYLPTITGV